MSFTTIIYTVENHVARITLNRPEVRNALNFEAYDELKQAFTDAQADMDVRCIVLTGADPAFCSGDDMKQIMAKLANDEKGKRPAVVRPRINATTETILECNLPVIAAVNGAAVGWGMELSLFCDIRIASERAKFGELFIKRALIPDVGGLWRLPQLVGLSKASELVFTGDIINAQEAERIGLVSKTVPHETLMDETNALASRIAVNAPLALRHIKEGMRRARKDSIQELGSYCSQTWSALRQTEDHQEGIKSFTEKRPAVFTGK